MSSDTATQPVVQVASPELLIRALMLLLADEPQAARLGRASAILKATRGDRNSFGELLVALRQGMLVGAVWSQRMPGRTATLWPPRLMAGEPEQTALALLAELDTRLRAARMPMIQAVLKPSCRVDTQRLERFGFEYAVDLLYLLSEQPPSGHPTSEPLQFELYRSGQRQRMAALIEDSYEATRDIPQLNGVRDIEDVLDGYEQTGAGEPNRWFFVRCDGADVGCLLLADHSGQGQWELVYMGVTPRARGRGWGQLIVEFAQRRAAESAGGRLVLAVDAANEPALRIYTRAGFTQCDRRSLYLKIPRRDRLSRQANQFRHEPGQDSA